MVVQRCDGVLEVWLYQQNDVVVAGDMRMFQLDLKVETCHIVLSRREHAVKYVDHRKKQSDQGSNGDVDGEEAFVIGEYRWFGVRRERRESDLGEVKKRYVGEE
ncbi:hypothetical protein L2E82_48646 [Cichorium intybus]|uniref:Uncharacterized protein n=1 Tax=Cichorium intybus TaxID=13427 RepID=A0ACB8YZS9_CICIN|nr:hypothetical protein L2E82_48646 [Cichorium intybus]